MELNKRFNKIWGKFAEHITGEEIILDVDNWKPDGEGDKGTPAETCKEFYEYLEKKGHLKDSED